MKWLALAILIPYICNAADKKHEIVMSLSDRFVVSGSEKWNVVVEKILPLRFANVRITPKTGSAFDMMLYFKCDTPDLAHFNTPKKIEKSVRSSSEEYLPAIVEKQITLKKLDVGGWYGYYTVITDKELVDVKAVPSGEFKYIMRGMIRLSEDSALGFSLMTNELETPLYQELFKYVLGFVKTEE